MTAVVTGASSGIGHAVVRFLLDQDYRVFGLGRSADTVFGDENNYTPVICDLARTDSLAAALEAVPSEEIALLVNAAGFGRFEPHETLSPALIADMTAVNLTAPMVLTNLLLRSLKASGGTVINITSVEALRASKFSALYSATKAGLRAFGQSLFEEVRKSGVNVVTLNPDMTDTPFFDALRFAPGQSQDTRLLAEDIVQAIALVLSMRPGAAVTELTVRPQRFGITKKQS